MATRTPNRKPAPQDIEDLSAKPMYLFFGGDEYLVSQSARKLVDGLCPPKDQALGLEIIDPQGETVAEAVGALEAARTAAQTLGFFGTGKVVWLRDASFFKNVRTMQSEDVKAAVERLVDVLKGGLAPGIVFVLSSPAIDKRTALYRAFDAGGHVVSYTLSDKGYVLEREAVAHAKTFFAEAGLAIDPAVLALFIEKAGHDTRQLVQEVEKLRVYLGEDNKVTAEDVRDIVSPAREALSWDLEDAVAVKDLSMAMRVLAQLLFQGESPMGMIIRLENRFRDLIVFQSCLAKNWCRIRRSGNYINLDWQVGPDIEEMLSGLKTNPKGMHSFRAGRLADQASGWKSKELLKARDHILAAHEDFTTRLPKSLIVELLILRLIGAGAPLEA